MAVILQKYANDVIPIEYVDSICESSYIESINSLTMKKIRELNSEAMIYGSSDVTPHLVKSKSDIDSKPFGLWILKSKDSYKLELYEKKISLGLIYNSYVVDKICEYYYIKCKRVVPRIVVETNKFEQFETELEKAVRRFKYPAERQSQG